MIGQNPWTEVCEFIFSGMMRGFQELCDQWNVTLQQWLDDMLSGPIPDDWRARLDQFVAETEDFGLEIEPDSIRTLEELIRSFATPPIPGTTGPPPANSQAVEQKGEAPNGAVEAAENTMSADEGHAPVGLLGAYQGEMEEKSRPLYEKPPTIVEDDPDPAEGSRGGAGGEDLAATVLGISFSDLDRIVRKIGADRANAEAEARERYAAMADAYDRGDHSWGNYAAKLFTEIEGNPALILSVEGPAGVAAGAEAAGKQAAKQGARAEAAGKAATEHHVMTNKNKISKAAGGPFTPKFAELAKRRGISLDDAINRIPQLEGHVGPHPQYNAKVFQRLEDATDGLKGEAFNQAFDAEMRAIREETVTAGSELNRLATGGSE